MDWHWRRPTENTTQFYLYIVLSSFGKGQRRDHTRYRSLSSKSLNNIPLEDRGGAWDSRNSTEILVQPGGHARHDSDASVATVMADKVQGYSDNYNYSAYPPPAGAYTQDPGPTPRVAYDNYYDTHNNTSNTYSGGVGYPERSQPHPGES